jgi:nitrogen regulatory protein PII
MIDETMMGTIAWTQSNVEGRGKQRGVTSGWMMKEVQGYLA